MEKSRKEQEKLKKENAASLRKAQKDHARMMEKLTRATLEAIEKNRKEYPLMLEKELNKRLSQKELLWRKEREKWAKERLLFLKRLEKEKEKPVAPVTKKVAPAPQKKADPLTKAPLKNAPGKKESKPEKEKKK